MNSTQPPNEEVDPTSSTPPSSSDTAPASSTSIPIDITIFQTLEARATELSQQLAEAMSEGTVEAGQVYHSAVEALTTELAACTQNTVQLITQCDELDKDLGQIQILSKQIKQVDKGLARLLQSLS
ncbi:hypothetical protein [Absidia glauca]|uniref:BLOC-1-related complex subunit 6 C-terminal helix domain-containing protein n=1 Tax=Absidia glauca TaxID=4829 RepID=A0A163MQ43_ABSGL|nr:hypothetical protein [Absidia glauca]